MPPESTSFPSQRCFYNPSMPLCSEGSATAQWGSCVHGTRPTSHPQTHAADAQPLLASGVEGKEVHKGNPKPTRATLIVG